MPVELHEEAGGKILRLELTGKLERSDYERFTPAVERVVAAHGKVRMLVRLRDFHGWTAGALWDDLKFDWKHYSDIERLALVGESRWHQGMAVFCKPFTTATVRYFDEAEAAAADAWIHEGVTQPVESR